MSNFADNTHDGDGREANRISPPSESQKTLTPSYQNQRNLTPSSNAVEVYASESAVVADRRKVAIPEELSRNMTVLSCKAFTEGGVCGVYLIGILHGCDVVGGYGGQTEIRKFSGSILYYWVVKTLTSMFLPSTMKWAPKPPQLGPTKKYDIEGWGQKLTYGIKGQKIWGFNRA